MALTTKRIIALPSQTEPQEGDYLAIDNAQGGTHKIPVGSVGVEVDDTLTESGKAADAKAVGDALDEIRSQVEATGDAIDALRSQLEVIGTASGAIAAFSDGSTMPMKSCIVSIEPQQSGTGTPSPDNVRPISGWESVNLYKSGKNLFDKDNAQVINAYIANGLINGGSTFKSIYIPCKPNTTYTISAGNYTRPAGLLYTDELPAVGVSVYGDATAKTVTTGANAMYLVAYVYNSNVDTHTLQDVLNAIQIELGSTATDYEPYTGTTTTTSLGRTVYGGTLDVVSGVLTVDRVAKQLTSAESISVSSSGATTTVFRIPSFGYGGVIQRSTQSSSHFTYNVDADVASDDRAGTFLIGSSTTLWVQVPNSIATTVAGLKAWLDTQEVILSWQIATPQTYQLTPTQINTLLGDNNVWADSGDVEVVYVRDLNITINNLLNSNGTRSLGMMMSAPTEAPTDEQTEEPAEDDMR